MHDSTTQHQTLVATFSTRENARDAADDLADAGYHHTWIAATHVDAAASPGTTGAQATVVDDSDVLGKIGRFFSGEGDTSLATALRHHGVSDTEADRLEKTIPAGCAILVVADHGGADTTGSPSDVIEQCGGRIVSSDTDDAGLYDFSTERAVADDTSAARGERRLKLREERLSVDKQQVRSGEAQVRKDVVEQRQTIDVPTYHEELYIERRPVSSTTYEDGTDIAEDTVRIPLTEERLVVEKHAVTTEEVVIGKRRVEDTQRVSDTVRKEVLSVDNDTTVGRQAGLDTNANLDR